VNASVLLKKPTAFLLVMFPAIIHGTAVLMLNHQQGKRTCATITARMPQNFSVFP
jgi:hypothetical protein